MADYTTLDTVKSSLKVSSSVDDALLARLITRASALVDSHCGRWFVPVAETRQYSTRGNHITGRLLLLDADLLSVSSVTLADGSLLGPTRYILRPVNWPPYFGISLKQSSGLRWESAGGPDSLTIVQGLIAVSGLWGYAATVPVPVVTATIRLVSWLYHQRYTDTEPEPGEERGPALLPADIRQLLGSYVRLRISAYRGAA